MSKATKDKTNRVELLEKFYETYKQIREIDGKITLFINSIKIIPSQKITGIQKTKLFDLQKEQAELTIEFGKIFHKLNGTAP